MYFTFYTRMYNIAALRRQRSEELRSEAKLQNSGFQLESPTLSLSLALRYDELYAMLCAVLYAMLYAVQATRQAKEAKEAKQEKEARQAKQSKQAKQA